MPTLLQQRESRANLWSQMQEIREHVTADGWTDELRQKWDRADAELVPLDADITREERDAALAGRFNVIDEQTRHVDAGGSTGNPGAAAAYRQAFEQYVRRGAARLNEEQRTLLEANFRAEERALQTDTGSAGGYLVPEAFWAKVTETMKMYGGVRQVADFIGTSTGAQLVWPTNDDTGNTGEILEEGSDLGEQDASFGQKKLSAFTASSKIVKVSKLLIQDAGVDVEALLGKLLGIRIGRIQNTRLTTGTGANTIQGLITGASTGATTASPTAIVYTELVDLEHSVDAAYRAGGNCKYMFHDLILAYLRKLLDTTGRPLWQPSMAGGVPNTINNYPYVVNNDMDSTVAATKKVAAFGDFTSGYVVRVVNGGEMARLDERYAEKLQVGFFGYERFDGVTQDASAYKLLLQHA